jgi:hypothetical protein
VVFGVVGIQIFVSSSTKNGIIYRHDQPQACQPLNGQVLCDDERFAECI